MSITLILSLMERLREVQLYKLRSQTTLSFLYHFVVLFLTTYTTQVTYSLYESSELKILTV